MGQEASFTFTTPLNVNIVEIKGVEHTFVEGDISTNDIDFVNDIMSKKCQDSMQKQILERNMKLDVEHEALREESLNAPATGGSRRPFVSFTQPDHDLRQEELLQAGRPVAENFLARLGISKMGLIRNFRLCFFTFGYTRVSAVPVINNKHHTWT